MLNVINLTKKYGKTYAVNDISFYVNDGEIAVLLGPNGAGKSTSIKCITGLLKYEGQIDICGYTNKSLEAKRLFGYVPETPAMYEMLTVYEHLEFIAGAYKIEDYKEKAEVLLERFELSDKRDKLGKELSKGMQQKVQFIGALLHEPQLIIMDEPFSGLDPSNAIVLKDVLLELKKAGKTLLLSTHRMDQAERMCDSICLINHGRALLEGDLRQMKSSIRHAQRADQVRR